MTSETLTLVLTALLVGFCIGGGLIALIIRRRARTAFEEGMRLGAAEQATERRLLEERLDGRLRELRQLELRLNEERAQVVRHGERLESLAAAKASAETQAREAENRILGLADELEQLRGTNENLQTRAAGAASRITALETQLEEAQRVHAEKEALLKDAGENLKREFQLLANQLFEEKGQYLGEQNRQALDAVLSPFKDQIADFRRRVEDVYVTDSKERASLITEIRNLQEASERINLEAENLTRALKGDKKVQGNWGELVLERVLEESGLRKDHEYETQLGMRDEEGDLKRPDVVIHLPGDKDVVVDAKVSLNAYERALATNDDEERAMHMARHVADLRAQVRRLSQQHYDELPGVRSLDFVLLFVPVEPAFNVAVERDPQLFSEAFSRRIIIVSPTTLMLTLRIIHNVWRHEKQNRNAQEIARRAGSIYDKLRGVIEDMDRLGHNLRVAGKSFDSAVNKLRHGRGNLVKQVEEFRELGAEVRREMRREVIEEADGEIESRRLHVVSDEGQHQ
jgi:DNA recombination protein RmuC